MQQKKSKLLHIYTQIVLSKRVSDNKGIALITILWISVILSSIVSIGAYIARIEIRQVDYSVKNMQLLNAASAGIEKMKARLSNHSENYTCLNQEWKNYINEEINGIILNVTIEDQESKGSLNAQNPSTKTNINTAPVEVLAVLPDIDYITSQNIIAERLGPDLKPGTEDDRPFKSIFELKLKKIVKEEIYNKIKNLLTVQSLNFKVISSAKYGKYTKVVETMLYKQGQNIQVKYWREL